MSLQGKKILLGVSGGIAAYKCAYLIRLLIREGATVRVVMTPEATAFIGAVTLSALSRHPVAVEFFNAHDGTWNNHVELGMWGDIFLIAPATANTIAKMSVGISDNVLLATWLSARCPVAIAPAMDLDMWHHSATRKNIAALQSAGVHILQPETGELASGLTGEGRMPEPETMVGFLTNFFSTGEKRLLGKKILITAGPTYEMIDPVRFIGNYSSGKMGFALAAAAAAEGAEVTLVHGPVQLHTHNAGIRKVAVTSAQAMLEACAARFAECDVFIAAAAVADFTPEFPSEQKIKKTASNAEGMTLPLRRTVDILRAMSAMRHPRQLVVGFALETENEKENARRKLEEKELDMIVLNSLQEAGAGFGHATNKISILDRHDNWINFELKSKEAVANDILNHLITLMHA